MKTTTPAKNPTVEHGGAAVLVKYYGPSGSKGSRLKVWANGRPARWYSRSYEAAEDVTAVRNYIESTFPLSTYSRLVKLGVDEETDAFAML